MAAILPPWKARWWIWGSTSDPLTAMEFAHTSVLAKETLELYFTDPEGVYLDGTLGGGGHAEAVLEKLEGKGRLIGIDRDPEALQAAKARLSRFGERFTAIHGNFSDVKNLLGSLGIGKVTGILLDLGVSSHQFDDPSRGFSYQKDGLLDMRMDPEAPLSAADIVNHWEKKELVRILKDYGEERFASRIAERIVREREKEEIKTTLALSEIVKNAYPAKFRAGGHPAKKSFQAIRIAVNGELEALDQALEEGIGLLQDRGRMAVITFHSLEDRRVKEAFKQAENPCVCPPGFPVCVCGKRSLGRAVTKKPVTASDEELTDNNRAHSAKLRVFERIAGE